MAKRTSVRRKWSEGETLTGSGPLPLRDRLAVLPEETALSVEVPMDGSLTPEQRVRSSFEAAQELFVACHR